jgi:hypothetical protein
LIQPDDGPSKRGETCGIENKKHIIIKAIKKVALHLISTYKLNKIKSNLSTTGMQCINIKKT